MATDAASSALSCFNPTYVMSKRYQTTHPPSKGCFTANPLESYTYYLPVTGVGNSLWADCKSMRERLARHRASFRTTPMFLYSHFQRYHHTDSLDVSIVVLSNEKHTETRQSKDRDWIMRLGTVIPHELNNVETLTLRTEVLSLRTEARGLKPQP